MKKDVYFAMNATEYEQQFSALVAELKKARDAYEEATPATQTMRLAELTILKDKLLSLARVQKSFPKATFYKAPTPANEQQRLNALDKLKILDTPYEELFDSITQLASEVCGTPIALISLLDADRQWFKAKVGLPGEARETPREMAFCGHAILQDKVLEIPDTSVDIRFADNPLVLGQPDIRFYAGAPITLPQGEKIGTLCVIDRKETKLTDIQIIMLEGLATIVAKALLARTASLNA